MRLLDSDWLVRVVTKNRLLPLGDDWLIFVDFLDEGRRRHAAVDLRRLFVCQETRHAFKTSNIGAKARYMYQVYVYTYRTKFAILPEHASYRALLS